MKKNNNGPMILLAGLGSLPVIWLALRMAPYLSEGLKGVIMNYNRIFENPLQITFCESSLKTVLIFLMIYALAIAVNLSDEQNYRRKEEHGSAQWGVPGKVNRKYAERKKRNNRILTQHVAKESIPCDASKEEKKLLKKEAREERHLYTKIKSARWEILARESNLPEEKKDKLQEILESHSRISICYAMKEEMCNIFDTNDENVAAERGKTGLKQQKPATYHSWQSSLTRKENGCPA